VRLRDVHHVKDVPSSMAGMAIRAGTFVHHQRAVAAQAGLDGQRASALLLRPRRTVQQNSMPWP
jgi:hypothetical protein